MNKNPRGSEWHRWDPHLHAPGTLLNDQFGGDWEAFLDKVEASEPEIRALGVCDYFSIGTYRAVRAAKQAGRLPNVLFLFPNVELRLDVRTHRGGAINVHLLFSPHDADHEEQIRRVLGRLIFEYNGTPYNCSTEGLAALGRAFDPQQADARGALKAGANQFKASFAQLRGIFRDDEWLRESCLVAVAAATDDGTSGLQRDASFAATREEIERFADIIFSGSPAQRAFWLGQHPSHELSEIERRFGSAKPCLHGSDGHDPSSVDQPEENLDPQSVYSDLVPHFREARLRRQVVVVTHNANLVVNTDADQVIVAGSTQSEHGGLPDIDYVSGSLENSEIRNLVCDILEGGRRAFAEREKRYRIRWRQMLAGGDAGG